MFISELFINEAPLPPDWDTGQFTQGQSTFKGRLAYALERAKKLGAGSSRVAMIIDYEGRPTALKVAKNGKGIAQNQAEIDILSDGYASQMGILIPIIDYDQVNRDPLWLQTEIAQKTNETQLCNLMGCRSLRELVTLAEIIAGGRRFYTPTSYLQMLRKEGVPEETLDVLTEYAHTLAELQTSFNVKLGDISRAANWGIYQGKPVIIDIGFTEWVFDTHYKRF